GLKEKTMAAYRSGIKTVIIPADNAPDLEEVDSAVKDHVRFKTVEKIDQVLQLALTRMPEPQKKREEPRPQVLPAAAVPSASSSERPSPSFPQ
ncbi:MAG TPA: endopeptidase La, partial [Ruminococcaceae bacterium]|nr:endopeptidase La [Oscillospiraceae bacterium]